MRILFYTHSLVSDWNHGNAHFLRGVMSELVGRGHQAVALEPEGGWSRTHMEAQQGRAALSQFAACFPDLVSESYGANFDHEARLAAADLVVVHEWTDPVLISRIGRARRMGGQFTLLFHDTHHRAVSADTEISALDLADYDGVLAFGETLRQRYLAVGWSRNVFTWHEAADTRLFHPLSGVEKTGDLIWIGNWGDGERSRELADFLVEPVRRLGLSAEIRGVRYPEETLKRLKEIGIRYGGWVANANVPRAFAAHRVTVHVPRRPYVEHLPGIPTIRMFEALACGIPLVSAPWSDCEGLFRPGTDFLFARTTQDMQKHLRDVLADGDLAASLSKSGLQTIRQHHTCRHRVDELFAILAACGTNRVVEQLAPEEAAQ